MNKRRLLALLFVIAIPFITPCGGSSTDEAPPIPAATNAEETVAQTPVAGGEFNRYFPADDGEFDVVFIQEQTGFAQANLNRNGTTVATLSVSDTATNVSARNKFANSSERIAGYPMAASGSQGTAVLVADRFQVQVRSSDASFTVADREAWLAAFDLNGIASLN